MICKNPGELHPTRKCKNTGCVGRVRYRQRYCNICMGEKRKQYQAIHSLSRKGLSIEERLKLAESQRQLCYVCNDNGIAYNSHLDHCHTTMLIRGLACTDCNSRLLTERNIRILNKLGFDIESFVINISPAQKLWPGRKWKGKYIDIPVFDYDF